MFFNAIKNIFTPTGDQAGISFIVNYIIIFLLCVILNYLGYALTYKVGEYSQILIFKILTALFFILSMFLMVILIFNYKRRFLNITKNLAISIILALIFGFVLDFIIAFIYFHPALFITNRFILPILISIIPSKGTSFREYLKLDKILKR